MASQITFNLIVCEQFVKAYSKKLQIAGPL